MSKMSDSSEKSESEKVVSNPFFGTTKFCDEEELTNRNFYKYYNKIYVLMPLIKPEVFWFEKLITKSQLEHIYNNTIVSVNKATIGKISIFYEWMKTLDKSYILKCKTGSLNREELDETVMVLPIFLMPYDNMRIFLEMYDERDWMEKFLINQKLADYLKVSKEFYEFKNALESSPVTYWCKGSNCKINVTEIFLKRRFRWNLLKSTKDTKLVKTIEEMKNYKIADDNYISMFLKSQGNFDDKFGKINFKLHRLPKIKDVITREQFNTVLTEVSNKNKFQLFMNTMVSPDYCHLVFNNPEVWDIMSTMTERCMPLIRYGMFYGYISLYLQENIKKTYLTKNDTCILSLDSASKLPNFPYLQSNVNSHPALAAAHLVKQGCIPKSNFYGLPYDITNVNNELNNLSKFKSNLNIFLTGHSEKNILCDVNFDNLHLTGSMLTACVPKNPSQLKLFMNNIPEYITNTKDYVIHRYFNEYYANSDIDILVNLPNPIDLYNKAIEFKSQVETGLCKYEGIESVSLNMDKTRKGYFQFNNAFLQKVLIPYWKEKGEILTDRYVIENLMDSEKIYKYFEPFYKEKQKEFYNSLVEKCETTMAKMKSEYEHFFSEITCENITFNLYEKVEGKYYKVEQEQFNKVMEKPITDEEIFYSTVESTKYKIHHPLINHPFEMFNIPHEDPWSCINKFHMGSVRGYYDGEQVYLTISAVMTYQTNMSPDYRIMFGSKDPAEICNKYRMRGYGVMLNEEEIAQMINYSEKVEFWRNLYNVDKSNKKSVIKFCGINDVNIDLYKPRLLNSSHYDKSSSYVELQYDNYKYKYISDETSMKETLLKKCKTSEYTSIDNIYLKPDFLYFNGSPKPLQRWMIDGGWDIFRMHEVF